MEFKTIYGSTVTKELVEKTKHLIFETEKNNNIDSAWFCNFSSLFVYSNDYEADKLRKITEDFKSDPSTFNFRRSSIEFDKKLSETIEKEFFDISNEDNKNKTPDGTFFETGYKNWKTYSVNGDSYLRRKSSMENFEELSTFLDGLLLQMKILKRDIQKHL